jgi:hypothetical protein
MKQDIRFKGLTLNKDEQAAEHGELALCGNVEVHDGALRPSVLKGTLLGGGKNLPGKLLYVHVTPSGVTNFIVVESGQAGNFLKWYRDKEDDINPGWYTRTIIDNTTLGTSTANITYNSISSVGNTLCIMTSAGLWYALFKDNTYTTIGQQPPFVELQFNMNNPYSSSQGYQSPDNSEDLEMSVGDMGVGLVRDTSDVTLRYTSSISKLPVTESVRTSITDQVMAYINKRIHQASLDGQFYAPFMVRYCYRLYDGSMIMHSAPVLMAPSLEKSVMVSIKDLVQFFGTGDYRVNNWQNMFEIKVFMMLAKLQVKWINNSINAALQAWSDIVKSVDVFITPQFSRIDTSRQIDSIQIYPSGAGYKSLMDGKDQDFIGKFRATVPDTTYGGVATYSDFIFVLPEYDEEEYLNRIRSSAEFFRVASYKIDDLVTELASSLWYDVDLSKSPLYNISTHEQMTDDYKTHNLLWPTKNGNGGLLYTYNHRLNVYDIQEVLFAGFNPSILFQYVAVETSQSNRKYTEVTEVSVFIKSGSDMKKRTYKLPSGTSVPVFGWQIKYFFYPDNRAVYMYLKYDHNYDPNPPGYQIGYILYGLSAHPTLNGAVYDKRMSYSSMSYLQNTLVPMADDPYSPLQGKIYTSRTDNPFYFPNLPGESCINTVGTGDIIGIAAVTRALSQGQVGDHDLVVFATDGIWVMKVSSTGTYSGMHNISREVCDNLKSICQLDQSIVFATKRSLSRFRESDVASISEVLDGPAFICHDTLPDFYNLFYQSPATEDPDPVKKMIQRLLDFNDESLLDIVRTGKVIYDFASSRLLVFDDYSEIALAFSLRDMTWSTFYTDYVAAAVPGYPYPYVQRHGQIEQENETTHETELVDIYQLVRLDLPYDYDTQEGTDGVVITRTLSFSDTMDVLRGFRQYCQCNNMPTLYFFGSNDQLSWQYIGHSARSFHNYIPGHPFRFFRVAIVMNMKMNEKYQSLALEMINKYAKL